MRNVTRIVSGRWSAARWIATLVAFGGVALPTAATAATKSVMPIYSAVQIKARCGVELVQARRAKATMERTRGSAGVLTEWNRLAGPVNTFQGTLSVLQNAAPDAATRDAAQACLEQWIPFGTELFQSEKLFERVRGLAPKDPVETMYRQDLVDAFVDSGAALPADKRARAKEIIDEIQKLSLQFSKNINDDKTAIAVTPAEAEGMSETWLAARKRDADGKLLVTLDYPTYVPFMQNAVSEAARQRVWIAKDTVPGDANLKLLDDALKLRSELARLQGYPDYATFSLRNKMAKSPDAVNRFLGEVRSTVEQIEVKDIEELRADKAAFLGKPVDQVKIERWDTAFYSERIRRARFAVDQEKLRAYFPTEASIRYTMKIAETLYGIRFAARDVPRWHPDVRFFDVYDAGKGGAYIGGIYLDLFPRDGKYNHAAAFPIRPSSSLTGERPLTALMTNFNRQGLDQRELETLLHEFGHVMHNTLSQTRFADQSGASVRRDFVEAPSQMFEEWARREEALALFAQVCPQCPRLTKAQIDQLDAARKFGQGMAYARQLLFATYDMNLHTGEVKPSLDAWIATSGATPLGYVKGTKFPAGFGHLFGYDAGYYSYMWAEVLALDMLSAFQGKMLDPAVGRRYRKTILEVGGEQDPAKMVEAFLGRKPSPDAFFAEIQGKRQ